MLPYVSLVDDVTVRTRGNELFQCLRLGGLNSATVDDALLDRTKRLFAQVVAQVGPGYAFYVHKVSKGLRHELRPVLGEDFAAAVDARWRAHLDGLGLRDRTLTLTVMKRPDLGTKVPFFARKSSERLKAETALALRKLNEVTGFLLSSFSDMRARRLTASSGELLGFLGALNTGEEVPIRGHSRYHFLAEDVANTRVSFQGARFLLSEGVVGRKVGTTFAIKTYPAKTEVGLFDGLDLPVDMVMTHSFTPINSNLMAERLKRTRRLMRASQDGALSLAAELEEAHDDLEARRLIFGDHHMTVTLFARSVAELDELGSEVRNIAASRGVTLVNEAFPAQTHYFAQAPGNAAMRARRATITNRNFADLAAFHRTSLGKRAEETPWGTPITMLPTPERSGYWFSHHEAGSPEKEPTSGHTLILGRSGAGKSVLAAFLMTQARRAGARVVVFDYRAGLEMAVRALGGSYAPIQAGRPTGLNPLWLETDERGQAWLADWLTALLSREDRPLSPVQTNRISEVVRQNAGAAPTLRNWTDLASLFASTDDGGDLHERIHEWTAEGRYGWIFGQSRRDTFSLEGDVVGFDLTGILDSESERERMAVLSYLFRRVERLIEDRRPTVILVDEAWKALDTTYFAERLSNWLVTARKQNAAVVMMTQYASQLERTRTGRTIVEAVPTQVLLPNLRARASDYEMLGLNDKELAMLLETGPGSRLALVRDDRGSTLLNADLSALGPLLTILGGMEKGEALAGSGWRSRPDFWRL
ncbi:type IV secretion system DNA-binding domain-containing protein [Rubellimicrobium aerolatum]|uniref:Type IV secretion system DNA-binding domain-containing protein n=1 Tax=Rubellimicrobium aerolatum TaxID=490979 RepID=A0ABW0SEW4_9RHOB|nr:type IV secretion system DNA-binding domain-containing protein [Rubellimicrobium aerolatum]